VGRFDRWFGGLFQRDRAKPMSDQGVPGFSLAGGYIVTQETNNALLGSQKWKTASELIANVSIIAASLRFSLSMVARPNWRAEPVNDTAEAKQYAEFVESVLDGIDTSWTRIVRRSAMYRFHGFNMQEWTAKNRDDGKIGIASVKPRPVHTIIRWDLDDSGEIRGVVQRDPVDGKEIYLPRQKLVYLCDDMMTDNPEGIGLFRHLVDPAQQLRQYLNIEIMGFERDLSGIPIGRAPVSQLNAMVTAGKFTREQADKMVRDLQNFVNMRVKKPTTGLVLDSEPFRGKTADGESVSALREWDLDLLTGNSQSMEAIGNAIRRLQFDMALVLGTEQMLVGREGSGSRALSEDKSRNLYLMANSALADMRETYDRDLISPLWAMNGLPEEMKPRLATEDASFKDAEMIAKVLAEMASAGAMLAPDDPAINDLRDLMNIERAPPPGPELMGMLGLAMPGEPGGPPLPAPPAAGGGGKGNPPQGKGSPGKSPKATKSYNPDQPRDPAGTSTGGQWTSGGGGGGSIALTAERKANLIAGNAGKGLDQLLEEASSNQDRLANAGKAITEEGLDFVDPGPKSRERVIEKVATEGYDGPHQITDLSRATVILDHPDEADRAISALAKEGTVYDKGWTRLPTNYVDRKVYIHQPNGGISEVQLVPRGMYIAKEHKGGHALYEIIRDETRPAVERSAAEAKSRELYSGALFGSEFEHLGGRP
jgi:hypothetical protein